MLRLQRFFEMNKCINFKSIEIKTILEYKKSLLRKRGAIHQVIFYNRLRNLFESL